MPPALSVPGRFCAGVPSSSSRLPVSSLVLTLAKTIETVAFGAGAPSSAARMATSAVVMLWVVNTLAAATSARAGVPLSRRSRSGLNVSYARSRRGSDGGDFAASSAARSLDGDSAPDGPLTSRVITYAYLWCSRSVPPITGRA